MKKIYGVCISASMLTALAGAATYTTDFENPVYTADADVGFDGVDGWSQPGNPNPAPDPGPTDYAPYAWIGASSFSGNAAFFGGFYSEVPDGFTVGRSYTGLVGQKELSFHNMITDAELYQGRDTFGFRVYDSEDDLLLTVSLAPVDQIYTPDLDPESVTGFEPGLWTVYYAFGTDTLTTDGNAFQSAGKNHMGVEFGPTGLTFNYGNLDKDTNAIISTFSANGTAAGYDVADSAIRLEFTYNVVGNGDDFFQIDNINVVDNIPEPSVALLGAMGGLALIRRRRRA